MQKSSLGTILICGFYFHKIKYYFLITDKFKNLFIFKMMKTSFFLNKYLIINSLFHRLLKKQENMLNFSSR